MAAGVRKTPNRQAKAMLLKLLGGDLEALANDAPGVPPPTVDDVASLPRLKAVIQVTLRTSRPMLVRLEPAALA